MCFLKTDCRKIILWLCNKTFKHPESSVIQPCLVQMSVSNEDPPSPALATPVAACLAEPEESLFPLATPNLKHCSVGLTFLCYTYMVFFVGQQIASLIC